jgi:hypothetical protein
MKMISFIVALLLSGCDWVEPSAVHADEISSDWKICEVRAQRMVEIYRPTDAKEMRFSEHWDCLRQRGYVLVSFSGCIQIGAQIVPAPKCWKPL